MADPTTLLTADECPATILAGDWSKDRSKRAVWMADVAARRISRVEQESWALDSLLAYARQCRDRGTVLVAVDLVLGVSRGYWREAVGLAPWHGAASFLEMIARVPDDAEFWGTSSSAAEWSVNRPFHAVPKGEGALRAFDEKAGYSLRRAVDFRCRSNPPFCVSGIPGSVGSGTRSLWKELGPALTSARDFAVWPFDGSIASLLQGNAIVLGELYLALAYSVALLPELPARRLLVGKTMRPQRACALEHLRAAEWIAQYSVSLPGLGAALDSEDDFDAVFGVAALLRRILDGESLDESECDDRVAGGGILLTSAIDFDVPAKRLAPPGEGVAKTASRKVREESRGGLQCPILGCTKVYSVGRSGWDAHVASVKTHPNWHPGVTDPEARKRLFERRFPDWGRNDRESGA